MEATGSEIVLRVTLDRQTDRQTIHRSTWTPWFTFVFLKNVHRRVTGQTDRQTIHRSTWTLHGSPLLLFFKNVLFQTEEVKEWYSQVCLDKNRPVCDLDRIKLQQKRSSNQLSTQLIGYINVNRKICHIYITATPHLHYINSQFYY